MQKTKKLTHQKFISQIVRNTEDAMSILRKKNADYGNGGDPFANFKEGKRIGVSVEVGMLTRMMDKLVRVSNLIGENPRKAKVKSESVEDTLLDLMNYANLLLTYIQTK